MGGLPAVGMIAAACAFASGACAVRLAFGRRARRVPDVLLVAEGVRTGWLASRLRRGIGAFLPPARLLLKSARAAEWAKDAVSLCEEKGYRTDREALISFACASFCAVAAIVGLATQSLAAAAAVPACIAAMVAASVRGACDARREAVRESVPDLLRSMEACFQTGYTLVQTFEQVAKEAEGPLRGPFLRAAHLLEAGRPASEALASLRDDALLPELSFVAAALQVQHETGGSLKQVLDAARETVEGEIELKRALRVHTAQAKLSARIVSVMPLILVALFSVVSEGFLEPFFESPVGIALLALAVGMQVAGIAMVRRMLAVEVSL